MGTPARRGVPVALRRALRSGPQSTFPKGITAVGFAVLIAAVGGLLVLLCIIVVAFSQRSRKKRAWARAKEAATRAEGALTLREIDLEACRNLSGARDTRASTPLARDVVLSALSIAAPGGIELNPPWDPLGTNRSYKLRWPHDWDGSIFISVVPDTLPGTDAGPMPRGPHDSESPSARRMCPAGSPKRPSSRESSSTAGGGPDTLDETTRILDSEKGVSDGAAPRPIDRAPMIEVGLVLPDSSVWEAVPAGQVSPFFKIPVSSARTPFRFVLRARALEFRGSEANYGFYVYMDPKDGQDGGDGAERRLSDGEGGPPDSKRSGAGSVRLDDTSPSVPEPSGGPGPARLLSPILASTANIRSKYIHRHLARSRMQHAQWADVLGSVAAGVAPSKKSIVDEPIKEETEGSEADADQGALPTANPTSQTTLTPSPLESADASATEVLPVTPAATAAKPTVAALAATPIGAPAPTSPGPATDTGSAPAEPSPPSAVLTPVHAASASEGGPSAEVALAATPIVAPTTPRSEPAIRAHPPSAPSSVRGTRGTPPSPGLHRRAESVGQALRKEIDILPLSAHLGRMSERSRRSSALSASGHRRAIGTGSPSSVAAETPETDGASPSAGHTPTDGNGGGDGGGGGGGDSRAGADYPRQDRSGQSAHNAEQLSSGPASPDRAPSPPLSVSASATPTRSTRLRHMRSAHVRPWVLHRVAWNDRPSDVEMATAVSASGGASRDDWASAQGSVSGCGREGRVGEGDRGGGATASARQSTGLVELGGEARGATGGLRRTASAPWPSLVGEERVGECGRGGKQRATGGVGEEERVGGGASVGVEMATVAGVSRCAG